MNSIDYYDHNAQAFYDRTIGVDMMDKYQKFLRLLPPEAKILDAGCGIGRDAKFFKEKGHTVIAFDASVEMVRLSTALLGKPTRHLTFQSMHFENEFEGVWAAASLLHVPYQEMRGVFEKIHWSLKDSGVFYASFKCGDKKRSADNRTFYDMTEQTILLYLNGLFESIDFWKTSDGGKAQSSSKAWLNFVCRKIG